MTLGDIRQHAYAAVEVAMDVPGFLDAASASHWGAGDQWQTLALSACSKVLSDCEDLPSCLSLTMKAMRAAAELSYVDFRDDWGDVVTELEGFKSEVRFGARV